VSHLNGVSGQAVMRYRRKFPNFLSKNRVARPLVCGGVQHRIGTAAGAVGQSGSLRGGCLPPPSRLSVPVGRLPIGRSLPSCPTTAPSALRAHTPGFRPFGQAIALVSTSISHTLCDGAASHRVYPGGRKGA